MAIMARMACRQIYLSLLVHLLLACNVVVAQMTSDVPSSTPSASYFPSHSPIPTSTESLFPSDGPSTFPSISVVPSEMPSAAPVTMTESPVQESSDVEGNLVLILRSVAQIMPDETIPAYNELVSAFFAESLGTLSPPVVNVVAEMTEQVRVPSRRGLRSLQDSSNLLPLMTTVNVKATTAQEVPEGFTLDTALVFAVRSDEGKLIMLLQENTTGLVDPLFFRPITEISAFTIEDAPTLPPDPTPTPAPVGGEDPEGDGGGLGTGVIAGIAIGGAVAIALIGGGVYMASRNKGGSYGEDLPPDGREVAKVSDPAPVPTNSYQRPQRVETTSYAAPPAPMPEPVQSTTTSRMQDTDMSVTDASSIQHDGGPDGGGPMGSSSQIDTDYGADNMSYTFSLDAGHVGDASMAGRLGASVSSGMQGMSIPSYASDDVSESLASQKPAMVSRVVNAPPGKLGIVIDTTLEGPVIHKVNPNSPLEGTVFPGDIIVAIDDVDTRAMSASAITALMVKTANQQRRLTVLSEDVQ